MHGQGTYLYSNGDKYVGEWNFGDKHGEGTFFYADGKKDFGNFENNQLNGYAIKYDKNGEIIKEGIFKNDEFLHVDYRERFYSG